MNTDYRDIKYKELTEKIKTIQKICVICVLKKMLVLAGGPQ